MSGGDDYPIEKTIHAEGTPVELSFGVLATFGTHDSDESGELLTGIVDSSGNSHEHGFGGEDWKEVHTGIFVKSTREYSRSTRESRTYTRILPEACPVTLHVQKIERYSASDYPHGGTFEDRCYAIVVAG